MRQLWNEPGDMPKAHRRLVERAELERERQRQAELEQLECRERQ